MALATAGYLALRQAALGASLQWPAEPWMNAVFAPGRLLLPQGIAFAGATVSGSPLPSIAAVLVALVVVLAARHALFWSAMVVIAWAIAASGLLRAPEVFGDRALYLASAGFCGLLGAVLDRVPAGRLRAASVAVAAGLVAAGAWLSPPRDALWRHELRLAGAIAAGAPGSAGAQERLGSAHADQGEDEAALAAYGRALEIDSKDVTTLYNVGVVLQRNDKTLEALSVFRRVTQLDPSNVLGWLNAGASNNRFGAFTPALSDADRAVALRPDLPNAHVVRGFALRGLGRRDEAQAAFERALELAPEQRDALLGLGAVALEQQRWPVAIGAFERLARVTQSLDAYRGLVHSYQQAGLQAEAARAAATARQRFPDDPFFLP
jgi:tetratricopeptide (TPR) repeat protein